MNIFERTLTHETFLKEPFYKIEFNIFILKFYSCQRLEMHSVGYYDLRKRLFDTSTVPKPNAVSCSKSSSLPQTTLLFFRPLSIY